MIQIKSGLLPQGAKPPKPDNSDFSIQI